MSNLEKEKFLEILKKHQSGILSPEEEEFLNAYFNVFELDPDYTSTLTIEQQENLSHHLKNKIDNAIDQSNTYPPSFVTKLNLRPVTIAASFIIITFISFYFGNKFINSRRKVSNPITHIDVLPGGNKAILTLANGSKISLKDVANGEISHQTGIKITKIKDGELAYKIIGETLDEANDLNTIETPRGGQYQIILPDGTQVWLNSASSLKFPSTFAHASQRIVELTGEAYFEVAHNKKKPFRVKTTKQEVEVLGTHFNINSYDNEPVTTTTLLEGSIKISHNHQSKIINRGQQAKVKNEIQIEHAEDNAIAWKNGMTSFNNTEIRTIMRQISRWYNVDVRYEGEVPTRSFTGDIPRNKNLSELIKILQSSNIRFKFDQKTITVMP